MTFYTRCYITKCSNIAILWYVQSLCCKMRVPHNECMQVSWEVLIRAVGCCGPSNVLTRHTVQDASSNLCLPILAFLWGRSSDMPGSAQTRCPPTLHPALCFCGHRSATFSNTKQVYPIEARSCIPWYNRCGPAACHNYARFQLPRMRMICLK